MVVALVAVGAAGVFLWRAGNTAAPGSSRAAAGTTLPAETPTVVATTTAGSDGAASTTMPSPTTVPTTPATPSTSRAATPTRITIAAVGDIMVHESQLAGSYDTATKTYDFHPSFAPIAPYLQAADFTVGNFETRTAGGARGYSGFPLFNTPAPIVQAVKDAGIDLVGAANNHSLDQDYDGLVKTLDTFDVYDLPYVGNYRSAADQKKVFMADVRGVKLAFLDYTEMLSRKTLPADKPWSVNMLGDGSACIAEAKAARAQGADLVIAMLHWGEEDQRSQSANQWTIGTRLLKNGVDVVVGSHPHVVQPIAKLTVDRGGRPSTAYVAYSLGNFLSNQTWQYSDSGIVLYVDIEKDDEGARVTGIRYLPVYVEKQPVAGQDQWRVVPVLPGVEPVTDVPLSTASRARMAQVWEEVKAQVDDPAGRITACSGADFPGVAATR